MSIFFQKRRIKNEPESQDRETKEGLKEDNQEIGSLRVEIQDSMEEITIPRGLYEEMVETLRETKQLLSKI
jgi:hypothetical protein